MRNPFTREPMISVNDGSLADYYENGGLEENIYSHLCTTNGAWWVNSMKVGEAKRLAFEVPDKDHEQNIIQVYVWILRVNISDTTEDDFRYFYSSQGVAEEKSLRGMN